MLRILFLAVGVSIAATRVAAQLSWVTTRIDKIATAQQDTVEARFHFKNAGNHDVTVLSAETSCGCTTAQLDKKTYAPGEEGDILAIFSVEDRSGRQEKEITVTTTEPADQPTVLTLVVTIPDTYTLAPRRLVWEAKEDATASQTVVVTATSQHPVTVTGVTCDHPNFKVDLIADETDRHYRIVVTPAAVDQPSRATLRIQLSVAGSAPRTLLVQALTRPPVRP